MRWFLESGQSPERLASDIAVYEILHIVEYRVVGHGALDNVKVMTAPISAMNYEVQPLLAHYFEDLDVQGVIFDVYEFIDIAHDRKTSRPANRLLLDGSTVEPYPEILGVFGNADFRFLNLLLASMVNDASVHIHPNVVYIYI